MTTYLPPLKVSKIFNIDDYTYQDGFIVYKEADERFLRPIQDLQQKTDGLSYNDTVALRRLTVTGNTGKGLSLDKSSTYNVRADGTFSER